MNRRNRDSMIEMSELEAIRELGDAMKALSAPEDDETGGTGEEDDDDSDNFLFYEAEEGYDKSESGAVFGSLERKAERSHSDPGTAAALTTAAEVEVAEEEDELSFLDLSGEYQVKISDPDDDDDDVPTPTPTPSPEDSGSKPVLGVGSGPMPRKSSMKKSPSMASTAGGGSVASSAGADSQSQSQGGEMMKSSSTVSFHKLEIREYGITLGDNVGCMSGPPVQLGWDYDRENVLSVEVDAYEAGRSPRKSQEDMLMPDNLRWLRLMQEGGYTAEEMRYVMGNLEKIRNGEEVQDWFASSASLKTRGGAGGAKKPSLARMKKILAVNSARRRLKRLLK